MTATQPVVLPVHHTLSKSKMDDRKRSLALDVDDLAPSRKRIVKDENGQQMRLDADKEKDLEVRTKRESRSSRESDELQNYQKDAILRQMKEYKREKKHYEELYADLSRKLTHHDDHLRAIDAWFAQLLDELRILAGDALPTPPPSASSSKGGEIFQSALEFASQEQFTAQLATQSSTLKHAIADIFARIPDASPDVRSLQEQITAALAKEKVMLVECQRLNSEKEQLTERLEAASWRYMKAEKALDRAKSAQVQKLERQAYANANGDVSSPAVSKKASTPTKSEGAETNGELENGAVSLEAEAARQEALALASSRMKQLEEVESENARLTNELSAARTKVASLGDDDYAESMLFVSIKSQFEDVMKRVNDLEATNIQLREEAQKLQQERTSYRLQVDEEIRGQTSEAEAQIARCEVDLARIRNVRDELIAEINVRKAAEDTRRTAADQARELAEARDQKIVSLESELARVKLQLGETALNSTSDDLDNVDAAELRAKLRNLEQQHSLLGQELPSIEEAWRKAQALASRKVVDAAEIEEKVARLSAEKVKAEQKYFAAMKAKDAREAEIRVMKLKDSRSSEIVSQLKEADIKTRELIIGLERQLAEATLVLASTEKQYRASEQKQIDASAQLTGMKKQVDEFKSMISSKDEELLATKKGRREVEDSLESSNSRLEESKKQLEALRKSRSAQAGSHGDDWRRLAICPVCNTNIRNTAIKLCGHVFCRSCVDNLISNRSRKCPSCGKAFGTNDHMPVVLT